MNYILSIIFNLLISISYNPTRVENIFDVLLSFNDLKITSGNKICTKLYYKTHAFNHTVKCWNNKGDYSDLNTLIPSEYDLKVFNYTSGSSHICISFNIYELRTIKCFGTNIYNQLDVPYEFINYNNNVEYLVSGSNHICAYRTNLIESRFGLHESNKSFYCWGANNYGQSEMVQFSYSTIVNELFAGYDNTCTVQGNNNNYVGSSKKFNITCFGKNTSNQLSIPIAYTVIPDAGVYVAIGLDNICGIIYDSGEEDELLERSIICWGNCINGICDIPDHLLNPFMVAVGVDHACSITSDNIHLNYGNIGCWGVNTHGQLDVPKIFKNHTTQLAVGDGISCALAVNWYFQCWGDVGNEIPDVVKSYTRMVSAGGRHSCLYDTQLTCYGNNDYQQLEVPTDHGITSIDTSAGWDYTCSIDLEMKIICWGLNFLGQTDLPLKLYQINHRQDPQILDIATGLSHSCAIWRRNESDLRRLTCWGGHSEYGETEVPSRLVWETSLVTVGDYHSCAIQNLNYALESVIPRIGCWGDNEFGQTEVPARVKDYGVLQLVAGGAHTCARIKYHLDCWGSDSQGQVSIDQSVQSSVYTVATGAAHTCIIYMIPNWTKDTGDNVGVTEVRCYGSWANIILKKEGRVLDTGFEHSCMVELDGKTYCWGDDEYGQLIRGGERSMNEIRNRN